MHHDKLLTEMGGQIWRMEKRRRPWIETYAWERERGQEAEDGSFGEHFGWL